MGPPALVRFVVLPPGRSPAEDRENATLVIHRHSAAKGQFEEVQGLLRPATEGHSAAEMNEWIPREARR